ncbi:MAG: DMT family transporter [Dehalococcoidia bacterium]|nr:DMT family transporter [Dehalococcoidia bacterium]
MEFLFQFAALFSAITWASSGAILKTIKFNKYFSFPFFEACISFLMMIIVILIWGEWDAIINENFDSYLFFSIAAFISCIGTVSYVIGIQKTSIGVVFTIASSSNVLVALLFDVILNSVRHSNLVLLGAFLVLSGILLMNIKSFTSHEKQRIIGVLGGIVAGSMWGIAVFFNDRALIEGSVLNGTLIRAIISIITLSLASYIFRQKIERIIEKIQFIKIFSAGSLITLSSLFWFISLDYTSGSITAIFGSTSPIFAIIFGYFFLKEKIYKLEYLSITLALIGIVIIIMHQN